MSKTYLWENFLQHPPQVQAEILAELELLLPKMTVKEQGETFCGCPAEITLKYLPQLADEAMVWVWKNALPVGARPEAMKLLSYEAKISLRLARRIKCL